MQDLHQVCLFTEIETAQICNTDTQSLLSIKVAKSNVETCNLAESPSASISISLALLQMLRACNDAA